MLQVCKEKCVTSLQREAKVKVDNKGFWSQKCFDVFEVKSVSIYLSLLNQCSMSLKWIHPSLVYFLFFFDEGECDF